jgi:hypothetical protein
LKLRKEKTSMQKNRPSLMQSRKKYKMHARGLKRRKRKKVLMLGIVYDKMGQGVCCHHVEQREVRFKNRK